MTTAEVEGTLVLHEAVAKAAVVGFPHDFREQGMCAYVTLNAGVEPDGTLCWPLIGQMRREIGPIAGPT